MTAVTISYALIAVLFILVVVLFSKLKKVRTLKVITNSDGAKIITDLNGNILLEL